MTPLKNTIRLQFVRVYEWLFQSVDPASLTVFRVGYGLLCSLFFFRFIRDGRIWDYFVAPEMHFKYWGFHWVQALPGYWMMAFVVGLILVGLLISLGYFASIASIFMGISIFYLLFVERTFWQNHIYFMGLMGLLLGIALPRKCSFDVSSVFEKPLPTVKRWQLFLLQFQVGLLYVYAAFVKMNSDWLSCQPIMDFLGAGPEWYRSLMSSPQAAFAVAYGTILMELLAVPLLLWRRTRWVAFGLIFVFHFHNKLKFGLDVFPYLGVVATTLLLPDDWPRRVGLLPKIDQPQTDNGTRVSLKKNLLVAGLTLYIVFQIVWPMRGMVYKGYVGWNKFGSDFSWRMMLDGVTPSARFEIVHPVTGERKRIKPEKYLTSRQYWEMIEDPYKIYQFVNHVADDYQERFGIRPKVYGDVTGSINQRPGQNLIKPGTNLAGVQFGWTVPNWIVPIKKKLPRENNCLNQLW
jgi:hypothetical protein